MTSHSKPMVWLALAAVFALSAWLSVYSYHGHRLGQPPVSAIMTSLLSRYPFPSIALATTYQGNTAGDLSTIAWSDEYDFAKLSNGGEIIHAFTSPTYSPDNKLYFTSSLRFIINMVRGKKQSACLPPETVLHPSTDLGECWPFLGAQGLVGIQLGATISATNISIDHNISTRDVRTTPKSFRVWGIIEDWHAALSSVQIDRLTREKFGDVLRRSGVNPDNSRAPSPESYLLLMAEFQYKVGAGEAVQTFPIFPIVTQSGLQIRRMLVEITDNWGTMTYTCIYRVRVHGQILPDNM